MSEFNDWERNEISFWVVMICVKYKIIFYIFNIMCYRLKYYLQAAKQQCFYVSFNRFVKELYSDLFCFVQYYQIFLVLFFTFYVLNVTF